MKREPRTVNRESNQPPNSIKKQNPHSTFEDLEAYQLAREFRKVMYRLAKRLPDIEKFGLVSQVRRAARDTGR
jgi:hypothetical protein